ncbi:MAG: hypothetical protein JWL71_679 [Acidobacteria bacterium]|nr:hypothetical protein [Acidobacteriota bacterium]
MAIALLAAGHTIAGSAAGNTIVSPAADTTGASLLIEACADYSGVGASTFTDSKGNTPTALTTRTTNARLRSWYVSSPIVGTGHTVQSAGTGVFGSVLIAAFSGVLTSSSPFDQQNGNTASSGTSLSYNSVTPGFNDELLIAILGNESGSNYLIDSGFTLIDRISYGSGAHFGLGLWYKVNSGGSGVAVTPTASWTTSGQTALEIATFKPAPVTGQLFRVPTMNGLGAGGGFFHNPLG